MKKQSTNKSNLSLKQDKAIYNAIEFLFLLNKNNGQILSADQRYSFLIEKTYGYIKLYFYKTIKIGIFEDSKINQMQFSVKLKNNELIYLDTSDFGMIDRRIPENRKLLYNILYKFINLDFLEGIFNDWSN